MEYLNSKNNKNHSEVALINFTDKDESPQLEKDDILRSLGLNINKKTIIVYCNCWPDFPNALGKTFFKDYVDFFNITYRYASKLKKYNWVFKAHPAEYMYGNETTLNKLMKSNKHKHIKHIYNDLDWTSITKIIDFVVTSTGSIGHEFVGMGGRVLCARQNSYSSWGFSKYCKTKHEYFYNLKNFENMKYPSQTNIKKALAYTALQYFDTSKLEINGLSFPMGRLSYRLWPFLHKFIDNNQQEIKFETKRIKNFIKSEFKNYSVYKFM